MLYAIYLLMIAASLLLIGKLLYIQLFFKPDEMLEHVLTQKVKKVAVEAKRGEILDCKGRTLALSYPRYKIYMDCTVRKKEFSKLKEEKRDTAETRWRRKAAALSEGLAEVFPEKSAKEYYGMIIRGRERGQRYLRLGTYVERPELLKLKEYPLFNEPQYKGGIIVESENLRRYPFGKRAPHHRIRARGPRRHKKQQCRSRGPFRHQAEWNGRPVVAEENRQRPDTELRQHIC